MRLSLATLSLALIVSTLLACQEKSNTPIKIRGAGAAQKAALKASFNSCGLDLQDLQKTLLASGQSIGRMHTRNLGFMRPFSDFQQKQAQPTEVSTLASFEAKNDLGVKISVDFEDYKHIASNNQLFAVESQIECEAVVFKGPDGSSQTFKVVDLREKAPAKSAAGPDQKTKKPQPPPSLLRPLLLFNESTGEWRHYAMRGSAVFVTRYFAPTEVANCGEKVSAMPFIEKELSLPNQNLSQPLSLSASVIGVLELYPYKSSHIPSTTGKGERIFKMDPHAMELILSKMDREGLKDQKCQ